MIDIKEINKNVENCPKPEFCEVPEVEWRNALLGAQESLSNADLEKFDTETYWSLIWNSALYFCKGMMYEQTKPKRQPYNWPIY